MSPSNPPPAAGTSDLPITPAATFCATLVDEWVHQGMTDSFVAPGSRSTPLALALAADTRISLHLFHDERAAAFAVLGHGLATGRAGVALCTSGTAAAHFHAAVIEASLSSVPMIVCTANRPPELWDVGAPQTIDQDKLYGTSPRWFFQPGVPTDATSATWRPLARRAIAESAGWNGPPGPVHLDLSFRDPLVGSAAALPGRRDALPTESETHAPASVAVGRLATSDAARVAHLIRAVDPGRGGVIVAGRGAGDPDSVLRLGERLGWPVLADHRSGCRVAGRSIVHNDALLRVEAFGDGHRPHMVLRLGEVLTSKITEQWLAAVDGPTVVATSGRWIDPAQVAELVVAQPHLADQLLTLDLGSASSAGAEWLAADALAAAAITSTIEAAEAVTEPGVARRALAALGSINSVGPIPTLVASSSMPVRDVEWYAPPSPGVRVLVNRGANGIDGVVSTAIGVALTGAPTICLIGDVALLHDSTALIALTGRLVNLTVLVVDNDGGGIFSFLPQRSQLDPARFEQLFGTPHGTDLLALARAHGIAAADLGPDTDLTPNGVRLVRASTDREANTAFHAELNRSVAAALAAR